MEIYNNSLSKINILIYKNKSPCATNTKAFTVTYISSAYIIRLEQAILYHF